MQGSRTGEVSKGMMEEAVENSSIFFWWSRETTSLGTLEVLEIDETAP